MKFLLTILLLSNLGGCVSLPFSEKLDRACTFGGFAPFPIIGLVALVAGCYIAVDQLGKKEVEDEEECEDDDEDCE